MHSPMMGLGSMPMLQNRFQNLDVVNGKGKGKAIDFDAAFAAAFAAAEKERMDALTSKLEQAKIVEVQGETSEEAVAVESDFQKSVCSPCSDFQSLTAIYLQGLERTAQSERKRCDNGQAR